MQAKVSLQARVNDGTGRFPQISAEIHRRAILIPVERKSDGRMFDLKDIIGFYARYPENGKRVVKPLGTDPVAAYTQFVQIEQDFSRVRKGLLPLNPPEAKPAPNGDRDIRALAAEYKANLPTYGKKKGTITQYSRAIDDFVSLYTKTKRSIDDVDENDITNYLAWMRTNVRRQKNKGGDSQHTYRNRIRHLYVFLNQYKAPCPVPMRKIKKPVKTRPWKFSNDVINLLLSKATREQKDLIQFLVNTGFRDDEVAFAKWSDIDLVKGSINVYPKPQFANRYGLDSRGWIPKDGESREQDIVLDPKFVKIMRDRKARTKARDDDLVFPTPHRNPDIHLIKKVRKAAKAVGFPEKRISLHAFRRTFGTLIAKAYGIEQARIWLGHSDIQTTQRYLAADEMTTKEYQKKSAKAFEGIGD
jgi:integrase